MTFATTILLAGIGAALLLLLFLLHKISLLARKGEGDQSFVLLNQNIHGMQERIDKTTAAVAERLDRAAQVIATVSKELGQVQEMGRHMQELQDFLRSPKLRGNIGEQVLRDLLEQYFSRDHFAIQHKFHDGQVVDAIVKASNGIIPIDAKFPMENFQKMVKAENEAGALEARHEFFKDVKKHITDIAKKYILPHEGTVDFAVMYVPSEAVYYEIIRGENDLHAFAYDKKVFIVSPNSFYYFLKILMIGMEGRKLEENIKHVQALLAGIHQDAGKFGEVLSVLNTHVTNAKAAVDRVNTEYAKLSGKIDQVKLLK